MNDNPKRQNSVLIPYKRNGDELSVYLQRRSADAVRLPSYFGLWGGGIEEGETTEQALQREIKEELGIELDLAKVELLSKFEFLRIVAYPYILEVDDDWDKTLTIGEGDYGKWFTMEEAFAEKELILLDKVILNSIEMKLLNKPIK